MADEPKEPKPPQVPTGEKPGKQYTPCVGSPCEPVDASAPAAPPKTGGSGPSQTAVVLQTPLDNEIRHAISRQVSVRHFWKQWRTGKQAISDGGARAVGGDCAAPAPTKKIRHARLLNGGGLAEREKRF